MNAQLETQLQALGDSTRRGILAQLRSGPVNVAELARRFPVSRPAISQHLRVLKEAQLVRDRAVGARRFYELDPAGFASLRDYFDQFWSQALASFQRHVESVDSDAAAAAQTRKERR